MKVRSHKLHRLIVAAGVGGMLAVTGIAGGALASASQTASAKPVIAGSDYLALGDSVSFGYREANTSPAPDYKDASTFIGFPEDVAWALGLHVANAACPGETTASFLNVKAKSNGCENSPTSKVGYRSAYPLHVDYSGTQMAYAEKYLKSHPDTRLVTLMIGANDGYLCQETTKDGCTSTKELAAVLKEIETNVTKILKGIRTDAGYTGQLVIVNYYSTNYTVALDDEDSQAINQAVDGAAAPFHVKVANGYQAFRTASVHSGLNTCTAGLLTQLTSGTSKCGVHPSAAGADVLALAVERILSK